MPLLTRDEALVVEAMRRAQSLFPWLILGADFDNDSAFMNDVVVGDSSWRWGCYRENMSITPGRKNTEGQASDE
jgi:hypothetical protein